MYVEERRVGTRIAGLLLFARNLFEAQGQQVTIRKSLVCGYYSSVGNAPLASPQATSQAFSCATCKRIAQRVRHADGHVLCAHRTL